MKHLRSLSIASLRDQNLDRRLWIISLSVGIPTCLGAVILSGLDSGLGFLAGGGLSWINFRWLKQGVDHLLETTRTGQAVSKRATRAAIFKYFLRYALIGLSLYATFHFVILEVVGFILGLFLVVFAVLVECILQLIRGCTEGPCHGTR